MFCVINEEAIQPHSDQKQYFMGQTSILFRDQWFETKCLALVFITFESLTDLISFMVFLWVKYASKNLQKEIEVIWLMRSPF